MIRPSLLTLLFPGLQSKKRARDGLVSSTDKNEDDELVSKKPKAAESAPPAGALKRAATIPSRSFRSPLRDSDLQTTALKRARDILAYVEAGNRELFVNALKTAFQEMTMKDEGPNGDPNYPHIYLALIYVAKVAGSFILSSSTSDSAPQDDVWRFLLERLSATSTDSKRSSELAILACNMLYQAFQHRADWPIEFVQAYLEDAFGPRMWVDDESTRPFVRELLSVTPQDLASDTSQAEEEASAAAGRSSPFGSPFISNQIPLSKSINRFQDDATRERVSIYASQIVEFHLSTLQSQQSLFPSPSTDASESLKNLIRTMQCLLPYPTVRVLAARHIDGWLHHPQTMRLAKELFRRLTVNMFDPTSDIEAARLMLRFKHAPSTCSQLFYPTLARLSSQHDHFRQTLLRDLLSDLLVAEANTPTGALVTIGRLFEACLGAPSVGIPALAEVIRNLAVDAAFAPNLKLLVPLLLSSWPSSSSTPLTPSLLCKSLCDTAVPINVELFRQGADENFAQALPGRVSQWARSIADTFAAALIFSVPKTLYDLVPVTGQGIRASPDQENQLRSFSETASACLLSAVCWCCSTLSNILHSQSTTALPGILHSFLLLDPLSSYYLGSQPLASDQLSSLASVISSIPIPLESSYVIFSTNSLLLSAESMFELHEKLVLRALRSPHHNLIALPQWSHENFVLLALRHALVSLPQAPQPENSEFGWVHPTLLWKALSLAVLVSPFASGVGEALWSGVPSGRLLMEMIITRTWSVSGLGAHWSNRLSAPIVTKVPIGASADGSPLKLELPLFSVTQTVLEPPQSLLATLAEWDSELKLSGKLLANRQSDYVSNLLSTQGSDASKWLAPLVFADANLIPALPTLSIYTLLVSSITGPSSSHHVPGLSSLERPLLRSLVQGCSSSLASSSSLLLAIFSDLTSGGASRRRPAYYVLRNLLSNLSPGSSSASSQSNLAAPSPIRTPQSVSPSPFAVTRSNSPVPEAAKQVEDRASQWLPHLFKLPFYGSLHGLIESSLMAVLQEEEDVTILEDILEHLCDSDRPISVESPNEIDQISLLEVVSSALLVLIAQGDFATLSQTSLVSRYSTLFASLLSPTSGKSSALFAKSWKKALKSSAVVWNSSILPATAFETALTLLGRTPSFAYPAPVAALVTALSSPASIEFPQSVPRAAVVDLFKNLDETDGVLPLSATQWAPHFGLTAPATSLAKMSSEELWALVGASEPMAEVSSAHMEVLASESAPSLSELTMKLVKDPQAVDVSSLLERCRLECENVLRAAASQRRALPSSISEFHQACVKIASEAKRTLATSTHAHVQKELFAWRSSLAAIKDSTEDPKLAFQLSQELSLLSPFEFLRNPASEMAANAPFRWEVSSLLPSPTSNSKADISSLINLVSSTDLTSDSELAVFTAHWLAKAGETQDCLPFVTLAFSKSTTPKNASLERVAMECLHKEGSWTTKKLAVEFLLGPTNGSSERSDDAPQPVSEKSTLLPPIESINVELALDFLALCVEASNESEGHQSSASIPTLLLLLSKPQLLRISDLVMLDLTQSALNSSIKESTSDRIQRRARLLMRCCSSGAEAVIREEKAVWLIEHISQMPGAYSMNTMRWLDDMTLASYGNAKPTTARPELLVSRSSARQTEDSSISLHPTSRKPLTVDEASEALLTHLYFEYPWEVFSVIKHFTNRVSATTVHSKLDYSLHRLLQRLSSESPSVSDSALLALRTCAYSHPAFIIKFMPTMSSLLNGKMQQGADAFYASNGPQILNRVLGVVEMLVPLVLHDGLAKERLHSMLNEYFRILSALFLGHGGARPGTIHLTEDPNRPSGRAQASNNSGDPRLASLISRLTYFLAAYCNEPLVIHEAVDFLTPHLETIEAISNAFPSFTRLRSVINSIAERRVIEPMKAPIETEELLRIQTSLKRVVDSLKASASTNSHADRHNAKSVHFNSDILGQTLEALRKVEVATAPSSAHCTVLNFLIADITPLMSFSAGSESINSVPMFDSDASSVGEDHRPRLPESASPFVIRSIESIRRVALNLSLLFLRCFPRASEGVVSAFVSCLGSSHVEVRNDALPHARDVFISCIPGRQQTELMLTLFNMGKHGQAALAEILSFVADLG